MSLRPNQILAQCFCLYDAAMESNGAQSPAQPDAKVLALFLDTNILLHYHPLTDADWPAITGAAMVKLVICLPVIHELDHLKDDPAIGGRAWEALQLIWDKQDGPVGVTDNASLFVYVWPDVNALQSSRDGDASIVRCVMDYANAFPDERVAIVSEDYGMLLRCQTCDIPALRPDSGLDRRLSPGKQASDKGKRPDIEIKVVPASASFDHKGPIKHSDTPRIIPREMGPILSGFRDAVQGNYFTRGMDEVNGKYLQRLESWLQTEAIIEDESARTVHFDVVMKNSGLAPAFNLEFWISCEPEPMFIGYHFAYIGQRTQNKPAMPTHQIHQGKHPYAPAKRIPENLDFMLTNGAGLWGSCDLAGNSIHFRLMKLAQGDSHELRGFYVTPRAEHAGQNIQVKVKCRIESPPNMWTAGGMIVMPRGDGTGA